MKKRRADEALLNDLGLESIELARALIMEGRVMASDRKILRASEPVKEGEALRVKGQLDAYVSRGAHKLKKALDVFGIDLTGQVCVDVGASTGGFTDVLLRGGARLVYAIDVGQGQLDPSLAADCRVVSLERVNARALESGLFPEPPRLGVMDVSFISIRLILPTALSILGPQGRMISLVKPQFEAGRAQIGKRGIVSSPEAHRQVLRALAEFAPTLGWRVNGLDFSPITGGDGNVEFLADLLPEERCPQGVGPERIDEVVRLAGKALR